mgnify:CR=1 FL=1
MRPRRVIANKKNEIVLAIDEACTNIIKHAYSFCNDKTICIESVNDNESLSEVAQ